MPQSLVQIYLHIVFSTKLRQPFLRDGPLRVELHRYLGGVCGNHDCQPMGIGGVEDHVHILCCLARTISVADLLRELKRDSSRWIKGREPSLAKFGWQDGYGVFSISPSHVKALQGYIDNQVDHHQRESFQDEFRRLLKKYGVAYDERYVWD